MARFQEVVSSGNF